MAPRESRASVGRGTPTAPQRGQRHLWQVWFIPGCQRSREPSCSSAVVPGGVLRRDQRRTRGRALREAKGCSWPTWHLAGPGPMAAVEVPRWGLFPFGTVRDLPLPGYFD